jgi:two-component system chemotaxis response regulator CheY
MSGFDLDSCFEASNGGEALDLLRTEWVDAILTDINMPEMDGQEFLRRLSQDEMLRSIPAIVISTDATANRMASMASLGARGYVTKPFLPETLRAELERTLGVPCE